MPVSLVVHRHIQMDASNVRFAEVGSLGRVQKILA